MTLQSYICTQIWRKKQPHWRHSIRLIDTPVSVRWDVRRPLPNCFRKGYHLTNFPRLPAMQIWGGMINGKEERGEVGTGFFFCLLVQLSAQLKWNWNKTASKQFRNRFETILKLFRFSVIATVRTVFTACGHGHGHRLSDKTFSALTRRCDTLPSTANGN